MSIDGFCELTLEARDMARLESFYTEVFGFEILAREDDRIWLAVGEDARLGIWSPGEKEFGDEGGRHVHFAFAARPGTLDRLAQRPDPEPGEHQGGRRPPHPPGPQGHGA